MVCDTAEEAERFLKTNPIPFPLLLDPEHWLFGQYDVASTALSLGQRPALFVIDVEGITRFSHVGLQQWEIPSNEMVLEQVRCVPCAIPALV